MRGVLGGVLLACLLATAAWLWGSERGGRVREEAKHRLEGVVYGEAEILPAIERLTRAQGSGTLGEDSPEALRVVFVGNSHTRLNGTPGMVAELARAAGQRPLYASLVLRDGATFRDHLAGGHVTEVLAEGHWDALVLQEQQQWASFGAEQRAREMNAPARVFDLAAKGAGARTVVMMTWARRDGDRHNRPDDSFEAMHERLLVGYRDLARELDAGVAPVAVAWKRVLTERPSLPLWAPDGYHPSPAGSYLAACVLYQALYGKPALAIPFAGGLPAADASFLQGVAASVFGHP